MTEPTNEQKAHALTKAHKYAAQYVADGKADSCVPRIINTIDNGSFIVYDVVKDGVETTLSDLPQD